MGWCRVILFDDPKVIKEREGCIQAIEQLLTDCARFLADYPDEVDSDVGIRHRMKAYRTAIAAIKARNKV
jgi:hypothetical protein